MLQESTKPETDPLDRSADLRKRIGAAVRNVKRKLDEAAQLEEILQCYLG